MTKKKKGSRSKAKDSGGDQGNSDDRSKFIFTNLVGQVVAVDTISGSLYEGVFFGLTSENAIVLKGAKLAGTTDVHQSLSVKASNVLAITAKGAMFLQDVPGHRNTTSTFRTDGETGSRGEIQSRSLQRWEPAEGDGLIDDGLLGKSSGGWDQFAVNGVTSTFEEDLYTSALPSQDDPEFRLKQKKAERLAREIQSGTSSNPHVREERGLQGWADDLDEEDRYSGVLAGGGPGKYVNPRRRSHAQTVEHAQAQAIARRGSDAGSSEDGSYHDRLRNRASVVNSSPLSSPTLGYHASVDPSPLEYLNMDPAKPKIDPKMRRKYAEFTMNQRQSSREDIFADLKLSSKQLDKALPSASEPKEKVASSVGLNPNAKSFSFDPNASSFTPQGPSPGSGRPGDSSPEWAGASRKTAQQLEEEMMQRGGGPGFMPVPFRVVPPNQMMMVRGQPMPMAPQQFVPVGQHTHPYAPMMMTGYPPQGMYPVLMDPNMNRSPPPPGFANAMDHHHQ